jgi:hypothetical protein
MIENRPSQHNYSVRIPSRRALIQFLAHAYEARRVEASSLDTL